MDTNRRHLADYGDSARARLLRLPQLILSKSFGLSQQGCFAAAIVHRFRNVIEST